MKIVECDAQNIENIITYSSSNSTEMEVSEVVSHADSSSVADSDGDKKGQQNTAWADAMSKILRTNKPKRKKTLVLSRAKKLCDVKIKEEENEVEQPTFEIEGEIIQEIKDEKPPKPTPTADALKEIRFKRIEWKNKCRVKPDILEKDRERTLAKIATKGVVQLFNVVKQQQKVIEEGLKAAGGSERKKEQTLRSVDKSAFLDMLAGPINKTTRGQTFEPQPEIKDEKKEEVPLWSVLRDDFLVGGKLKDWDKGSGDKEVPENDSTSVLSSDEELVSSQNSDSEQEDNSVHSNSS